MTREEQKCITGFIEQAVASEAGAPSAPLDVAADAIIRALFVRNPEAAYRITLLAMTQAKELAELKMALHEAQKSDRRSWISRLLGKPDTLQRSHRRDPRLSGFPQNIRSR